MTAAETPKATKAPTPAKQLEAWIRTRHGSMHSGWYDFHGSTKPYRISVTLPLLGVTPPQFHLMDARGEARCVELLPVTKLGTRLSGLVAELDALEDLTQRAYGMWALRRVLRWSGLTHLPAFLEVVSPTASPRLVEMLLHPDDPARWPDEIVGLMRDVRDQTLGSLTEDVEGWTWRRREALEVFAGLDDASQATTATTPATTTETTPQEPPAPALTLDAILKPSPPVLKRCASTVRGNVCGAEAHTEEEVERLFGWRWITADVDHPRRFPQGQCKACKSALNRVHAKARRSRAGGGDLRQADLLKPLPPPPARPDYFARLRALSALTIEGVHVGEGVTVARPPKLDADAPERLTVAGEGFVFYLRQTPLGAWRCESQTFTPQGDKKTVLGRWARAAAVIVAGLGLQPHQLANGPWVELEGSVFEWAVKIKAARDNTPSNPDNLASDPWQPSDKPAGDGAGKSVTTAPSGVTNDGQRCADRWQLPRVVTGCHGADQQGSPLGGEP